MSIDRAITITLKECKMPKLKPVNRDKFYKKVYRNEYHSTQIGFSTVRFTDAMNKLLGLVIFHNNGNTYLIK